MMFISEVGAFLADEDKNSEEESKLLNRCVDAVMKTNLQIPIFSGPSAESDKYSLSMYFIHHQRDAWRKYNNFFLRIKWNSLQQFLQKLSRMSTHSSSKIEKHEEIFERCANEYEVASVEYIVPLLECTRIVLVPYLTFSSTTSRGRECIHMN